MNSSLLAHDRLRPFARLITIGWLAYWVVLVALLHWPSVVPPIDVPQQDKIAHVLVYFLFAGGWVLVRRARRPTLSKSWLALWFVIFAAYAGADEIMQPLTNRDCSLTDWFADIGGIALALLLAAWLVRTESTVDFRP